MFKFRIYLQRTFLIVCFTYSNDQTIIFWGKPRLKQVPGGPNDLSISPPGNFDFPDSILKVLEAQELGNNGLSSKYIEQMQNKLKTTKFDFDPGNTQSKFRGFSGDPRESSSGRSCWSSSR